jgi:hypothetical protein
VLLRPSATSDISFSETGVLNIAVWIYSQVHSLTLPAINVNDGILVISSGDGVTSNKYTLGGRLKTNDELTFDASSNYADTIDCATYACTSDVWIWRAMSKPLSVLMGSGSHKTRTNLVQPFDSGSVYVNGQTSHVYGVEFIDYGDSIGGFNNKFYPTWDTNNVWHMNPAANTHVVGRGFQLPYIKGPAGSDGIDFAAIETGGRKTGSITRFNCPGDSVVWPENSKMNILYYNVADWNGSAGDTTKWQTHVATKRCTVTVDGQTKITPSIFKLRDMVFPLDTMQCLRANGCKSGGGNY